MTDVSTDEHATTIFTETATTNCMVIQLETLDSMVKRFTIL